MAADVARILISDPDGGHPPGRLRVRLMGGFIVAVDGRAVPEAAWRQRRSASIVKLLALEPTHRLHREQLMELLWPELDYNAQLNNLRQALHHVRRSLEAAGMPPGLALERDGDIVVLAPSGLVWVDAHAFERSVAGAWQALTPATAQDAIALYGGDLLPDDPYEEWAEQRRTTLRASYLALLARLATLYDERGEPAEAIGAWQRLVAADPANEAAHAALMRLYAGSGQRQHALTQFDQLVAVLERELDASPEPTTRELAEAIREGHFPEAGTPTRQPARVGPTSLPTPLSQFVGREQEQAEVRQLLASVRLLTLTGPGGIGKTRLAIEVARSVAGTFPDGVVFVDLAPVRDPERVIPAIAEALGIRDTGSQPLVASLRDKRLLLVLDNIEQVVAAGREIVTLLEQTPAVKALVTSRVRLRLRGEREYAVPPLGIAEHESPAVSLFAERARGVRPEFRLTDENTATVVAICRRLDGLPLAIELAATRARILSPQAILDRLEHPLSSLWAGASDLPERQRTLRATIDWSYGLLDAAEQALFMRLSVFAGGWTVEAAEAVGTDPAHPIDNLAGLDSLAAKNLITQRTQPDGEIRFGMLETIRECGLERLAASGAEPAIRDRHANWVVQLVEQAAPHLEGAEQVTWLARLERDSDNIRAGLDWLRERRNVEPALRLVRSLRLHWFSRGRIREGFEHVLAVTNLPESASYPALRADALTAAGFLARELGEYQRAYDVTRASLAISHRIRDRKRAADALVNLGFIALQRGQIDDARALAQRSLTTNQELNNEQGIADSLGFLALTDVKLGDLDAAGWRLEHCMSIWDRLDDLQGVAWASAQLGLVRLGQSDRVRAWNALMTSLEISASLDFRGDIYLVFDGLARLALSLDRQELACSLAAAAASVREQSGITLVPVDQERVDRLLADLHTRIGADTVRDAWTRRHDWTLERIVRSVTEALAPVIAAPATGSESTTPPVSQTGSFE